jgi:hypothetical protein
MVLLLFRPVMRNNHDSNKTNGTGGNKSRLSRRKILASVGSATIGSSVLGTASADSAQDIDIEISQVIGEEKIDVIETIKSKGAFRSIIDELESEKELKEDIDNSSVTKVQEENGEERNVVSLSYEYEEEKSDRDEIFIQYTGVDDISKDLLNIPNIAGYHFRKSESTGAASATLQGQFEDRYESVELVDAEGESTSMEMNTTEKITTDNNYYPDPGGGSSCSCRVREATGCAPSARCVLDMASAFAGSILGCRACLRDGRGRIGTVIYCAVCAGEALAAAVTVPSCLGCNDWRYVCLTGTDAQTVC